jgi:hypothetical protein
MSKLHELLSVEGDLEGEYKKILDETKNTFSKKEDHFFGFVRKLVMFDENAPETPDEHKEMVTTVHDKLEYSKDAITRYIDAVLQKESTNQIAVADLVIDGMTIAVGLPATFLLGLETKLKHIREMYETIPTIPPGIKWEHDPTKGDHVYSMTYPEVKFKTEKIFKVQVLYEATDKHPAQVEKIPETKDVGRYEKYTWSGMMSPAEKSMVLGRIDKLIRAVKKARQRANSAEVMDRSIGEDLFRYINGF